MNELLETFAPVTLEALDASVPFRVRADRKHVIERSALPQLLERLAPSHAALDIGGRRAFGYDTVYFDSPSLLTARAHVQRRRRRFKCRSRLYVDSGTCAFEVKCKSGRGDTIKHRLPQPADDHGTITAAAAAFLEHHAGAVPELGAVLRTRYTRVTLAGPGERVTIDLDLSYGAVAMRPGFAIVETKSDRGAGIADRVLRELRARPLPLSKYLLGTGLTLMPAPPNDTRRIARRYFQYA
jgi:hypothetical protein